MTAFPRSVKQRPTLTPGQICFGLFGLFCLILLLRNSEIAIEYMNRGLLLCVRTIIPSLFPFMVLSEWMVNSGLGSALPKWICRPLGRLLGLPSAGCCAALLGMLCGFPVGARCAALSYERGELTKKEAQRVLTFSNNPSSAFVISAVGTSLWGNRSFGLALYGVVITAAILTGILGNLLRKKEELNDSLPPISPATASAPQGAALFTASIRSATGSILLVCAYVVFFSTLMGTLQLVLGQLHLSGEMTSMLFCLLELSGGVSNAAALGNTLLAAQITAFAVGWSGLSVHCQVLSVCDGKGFSFRGYFWAKLFQGILCACLFAILLYFFPHLTFPAQSCRG